MTMVMLVADATCRECIWLVSNLVSLESEAPRCYHELVCRRIKAARAGLYELVQPRTKCYLLQFSQRLWRHIVLCFRHRFTSITTTEDPVLKSQTPSCTIETVHHSLATLFHEEERELRL